MRFLLCRRSVPITTYGVFLILLSWVAGIAPSHADDRVRVPGPAGAKMYRLETQAMEALNQGRFNDARDIQNELLMFAAGHLEQKDWRFKGTRVRAEALDALTRLPDRRQDSVRQAVVLFARAKQYLLLRRFEESRTAFEEAAEIVKDNLGTDNFIYAETLGLIGQAHLQERHFHQARQILQETADVKSTIFGNEHPSYALTLAALGSVEAELGDLDSAEKHYLGALKIRDEDFGDEFIDTVRLRQQVAALYLKKVDLESAERYASQASEAARRTLPAGNEVRILCQWRMAQCSIARKDFEQAEKIFEEVVPEFERITCNVDAPVAAEIIEEYASVLSQLSKATASTQMREWGRKVREDGVGAEMPKILKAGG